MFRSSLIVALAIFASSSFAQSSSFGALPGATFGGSGIDNTSVAITTIGGITLGLTAHGRFDAPAVTNDGAGTFFAQPGVSASNANYAGWNFGFYISNSARDLRDTTYKLFYDFNPAPGVGEGVVSFGSLSTTAQDSWNLGMGFLSNAQELVGITAPNMAFNPNAEGTYAFALAAYNPAGVEIGRTMMDVNVAAVPEPGTYALMFAGLGVIGFIARRRKTA